MGRTGTVNGVTRSAELGESEFLHICRITQQNKLDAFIADHATTETVFDFGEQGLEIGYRDRRNSVHVAKWTKPASNSERVEEHLKNSLRLQPLVAQTCHSSI